MLRNHDDSRYHQLGATAAKTATYSIYQRTIGVCGPTYKKISHFTHGGVPYERFTIRPTVPAFKQEMS